MAIDFPASPTNGQIFRGANRNFVYNATRGAWQKRAGTALTANKLINPAFQVSEQNGNNSSFTNAYYVADQWANGVSAPLTGMLGSMQRTQSGLPPNSANCLTMSYAAQNGTYNAVAGDYLGWFQRIEGNRIADLQWGTANAVPVVIRFLIYSSLTYYTFGLALRNGANNMSYTVPVSDANTGGGWREFQFAIPGPTTGTWPTDNTSALEFWLTICAGSNWINTSNGAWNAKNSIAPIGQMSVLTGAGFTVNLGEVGLYADPYNTGVAPKFQQPHYEDDLQDCMRYWQKCYRLNGVVYTATQTLLYAQNYVTMRIVPAASLVGTVRLYDGTVAPNATSTSNYQHLADSTSQVVVASGLTVGRFASMLVDGQVANYMALNARM